MVTLGMRATQPVEDRSSISCRTAIPPGEAVPTGDAAGPNPSGGERPRTRLLSVPHHARHSRQDSHLGIEDIII